jgi:uncharacterized protein (TIGR02996 family)
MAVTEADLVAGIVAAPDDDAPRTVYGDWLLDRGDPRGDLLIAQCALARADADDRPIAETGPLRDRVRALIASHGASWLDAPFAITAGYYELRRGMVEHVELMQGDVDAIALRDAAPILRSFAGSHSLAPAMFAAARVLPIDQLQLVGATELDVVRRGCTALDRLTSLELRKVRGSVVPHHVEVGRLDRLEIQLVAAQPGQAVLDRIAVAQPRLRHLGLANLTLADLSPIAALPLASLELAHLADVPLPANAQVTSFALAASRLAPFDVLFDKLPALRHLRLSRVRMSDRHAFELSAAPELARITRLDLSHNELTSDGARAIARSPYARNLIELRLTGNSVNEATRGALRDALPHTEVIA